MNITQRNNPAQTANRIMSISEYGRKPSENIKQEKK